VPSSTPSDQHQVPQSLTLPPLDIPITAPPEIAFSDPAAAGGNAGDNPPPKNNNNNKKNKRKKKDDWGSGGGSDYDDPLQRWVKKYGKMW
jgi:hypothetical protein